MPRLYDDICARCPFYRQSGRKNVMCEGLTDEFVINLMFVDEESRNRHRRIFCDAAYEKCEIFAVLEAKYDE